MNNKKIQKVSLKKHDTYHDENKTLRFKLIVIFSSNIDVIMTGIIVSGSVRTIPAKSIKM